MTTEAPAGPGALQNGSRPGAQSVDPAAQGPLQAGQGPVWARLGLGALAVAGATAVGLRWAGRPAAPRTITMGPGGWVSFKGMQAPLRVGPRRPWWAVLLRAQRLT